MTAPILSRVDGGVAHLTLNRPHARNAITVELASALHDALLDAAERARVIVVRGAGGHFCAGGDFDEVARLRAQGPEAMRPLFETFVGACELIAELPVPVVAAVEGYAMAGGFELIQSVDVAVVREDAVLADNHANLGMIPGGGGSQRLPRLVGPQRALGHILLGERISGAVAAQWGLVHSAAPAERFESTVDGVVANLLAKDPAALTRIKHLVRAGLRGPLTDGLAMETDEIIAHLGEERAGPGLARHGGRNGT
ncbi:enoyl-CoA hydratase/isomerase family protein [Pseudonocardia endophytica]|uniref:Enoyl-CoA hydratase/carnithine racemase n=1 Tax=Pseudonocardia endophytica TaxID=401976 RepID=A0A4R1HT46_PSEEN|nr:enoyl-CoA hydratase/isomerase family protein [Pseudonocardia endophytica]TCK24531.1 enoyl-CoA hydratase/carnithine racemase [Pseudonocardia endophytica]